MESGFFQSRERFLKNWFDMFDCLASVRAERALMRSVGELLIVLAQKAEEKVDRSLKYIDHRLHGAAQLIVSAEKFRLVGSNVLICLPDGFMDGVRRALGKDHQ